MPNETGLAVYQGGQEGRSAARLLLTELVEKARLRAALAAISAEIDASLPKLTGAELQELQSLMTSEIQTIDDETEGMRAEIAEEAELAKTTRPMSITLARRASAILGAEAERRISRGHYPSVEGLIGEAITTAFVRGGRP